MNDIQFIRGKGGLGRALAGEDHICGIVAEMDGANIPAALVSAGYYAVIHSVEEAADFGIAYSTGFINIDVDSLVYQIEQIFEVNEKAVVHLVVANTTLTETVDTKLADLQNNSNGKVRQALLLAVNKDFLVGDLSPIQAACDVLESEHKPISVVYSPNFVGLTITDDLRSLDNKNISVVIGADGNGKGHELSESYFKTFSCAGSVIGVLSKAKVHENIGWVGQFNLNKNSTNEFDVLKFAEGTAYKEVSTTQRDSYSDLGYIFLIKHIGKAGSYFNDSHTAIAETSDYAFIENNRTIDKAVRGCREFLLPSLNSPLYVNEDGTLTEDTIAGFKNDTERALEDMQKNGEISAFQVLIDPDQDVLSTSKLTISVKIVPVGVARNIVVNIGFAVNITA